MWGRGVAGLGVGLAGKSTADNTWTRRRVQGDQTLRIIITPFVVGRKWDLSKRNIVEEDIVATAQKDGNSRCPQVVDVVNRLPPSA